MSLEKSDAATKRPTSRLRESHDLNEAPKNQADPNIRRLLGLSLSADNLDDIEDIKEQMAKMERIEAEEEWKLVKRNVLILALSTIIVASSILITVFQSLLMSAKHYYFPFPLFSASVTIIAQFILASLILTALGKAGAIIRGVFSRDGLRAAGQAILPLSLVTSAELGISMISLQYVTVSFFTMVKSSSIIFVLIGSFMTGQERVNLFLISVILLTGAGVTMAAWDPQSTVGLNFVGFFLVIFSSILNATKWILTEMLLNRNEAYRKIVTKINQPKQKSQKPHNFTPLLSVLLLAPISWIFLIIAAVIFEGFPLNLMSFTSSSKWEYLVITWGSLLISSILIFVLRVADFRIVQLISIVSFSLLGIVKEIVMILVSVVFLGDILHGINVTGLFVSIFGVIMYNYYRVLEVEQLKALKKSALEIELKPFQLRERGWKKQVAPAK